jgi:hypothetical protein
MVMSMADFENTQFRDYSGPERRTRSDCPVVTESQIALMIEEEVERRLSKFEDKLMLHMDVKFAQLHKLISDAFPGGDPHGHRAYHELQIKQADGWDKIKGEVLSKFLTSGLWVAAAWLAFAVWQTFKSEVTK